MIKIAFTFLVLACAVFGVRSVAHFAHSAASTADQVVQSTITACEKPGHVVSISFSKTKYPHIRSHALDAERHGWPRVMVLERDGASARREKLLADVPTKPGYDRDEYPPAVGRSNWRADVAYVPSAENRGHGASMGVKINHSPSGRPYCDGTKFRYAWY